ncbi:uncharacterized protein EI97DRAFT_390123 [Westerdykella ornata]|uniref:RING-CH-type domain-containing protein n=1 Tax=Westerdykella ornata TaxID=318751 RepID=A0A6A6JXT9_WESOR|nr:uncharacterized protein EI97DRAFT_390123 [Westerdykella ornata]KAF2281440.1 hypothetical protein EI97DRAFT_390123 [Westerdykella ornata]
MSSSGFQAAPGWYWQNDAPKEEPSSPSTEAPLPSTPPNATPQERQSNRSGRRRTRWPPRQCRICLETVQPTTHVPSESLPGFLQPTPNVTYEDENGRLIRPCLCKGSGKYVHEGCLQAWRHADPSYGRRNYWECPTCGFKYRLARMGWGRWVASTAAQMTMTLAILLISVFLLGFVADPIIDMYMNPWSYLMPWTWSRYDDRYGQFDVPTTWSEHFAKGFAGMGVLGFLKVLLASPFSYFRIGGGQRRRGRATGRDRIEQVSWLIILIGVVTFFSAVYKGVRAWSRRVLEKAGERVMDVQQDEDDDDDDGEEDE